MQTIYALRDPNTDAIRYVGKTSAALGTRISRHLAKARHKPSEAAVLVWIRSLMDAGVGPKAEVLEVVPDRLGDAAEIIWIAQMRQIGIELLNQARGGSANVGVRRSDDDRKRVGEWSRDQWSERRDEIIAAQNAGKGAEWKAKHSALGKARQADPAFKKKVSDILRAIRSPESVRKEMMLRSAKKLTPEDAIEIRRMLASGMTQKAIAKIYSLDPSEISRIHTGKRWKYTEV